MCSGFFARARVDFARDDFGPTSPIMHIKRNQPTGGRGLMREDTFGRLSDVGPPGTVRSS